MYKQEILFFVIQIPFPGTGQELKRRWRGKLLYDAMTSHHDGWRGLQNTRLHPQGNVLHEPRKALRFACRPSLDSAREVSTDTPQDAYQE